MRHTLWRAEAEESLWEVMKHLSMNLEAALKPEGARPERPCPGCVSRDSIIAAFEGKNDVLEHKLCERKAEYHKLEADYAEQTSRLSYDLDQSRQATATMHAGNAAAEAEKATIFKRMKFLEAEMESMTQKMMKVLSENTEMHIKMGDARG